MLYSECAVAVCFFLHDLYKKVYIHIPHTYLHVQFAYPEDQWMFQWVKSNRIVEGFHVFSRLVECIFDDTKKKTSKPQFSFYKFYVICIFLIFLAYLMNSFASIIVQWNKLRGEYSKQALQLSKTRTILSKTHTHSNSLRVAVWFIHGSFRIFVQIN